MNYADSNPDERTADLEERTQDRHDEAADRADEARDARPRSEFADSMFEMVNSIATASRTSWDAGYAAGHHAGYMDAMREAKALLKAAK